MENPAFQDLIKNGMVSILNSKSPFHRLFLKHDYSFEDLKNDLESKKLKTPGQFMMFFKQILHNYKIFGDLDKTVSGTTVTHGDLLKSMTKKVAESLKTISRCGECFKNSNNSKKPCNPPHQLAIVKNVTVIDEKVVKPAAKRFKNQKNRENPKREKKSSWPGQVLRSVGGNLVEVRLIGYHDRATATRIVKSSLVELVLSNKDIPTIESIGSHAHALFELRTMVDGVDEEMKKNRGQKGFRKDLDRDVSLLYENVGRMMEESGGSSAQICDRKVTSNSVPDNPEIFEQFEKDLGDNLLQRVQKLNFMTRSH